MTRARACGGIAVRRLLAPSLAVAVGTALAAEEPSPLHGDWRCTGSNESVSFASDWSLSPDGDYRDAASVDVRQDLDGDSVPEDLTIESVETGTWSETDDGDLRFHVREVEVTGLTMDGAAMPVEQAKELLSDMTAGAAGRVMTIEVVVREEKALVVRVSGVLAECEGQA